MIGGERGAKSTSGITSRRLDPNFFKVAVSQNPPIRDAVKRHASREAQIFLSGLCRQSSRHAQYYLFQYNLHRCGKVHVPLREEFLGPASRPFKQLVELAVRHRESGAVVEVIQIQSEGTVGLQIDEVIQNLLCESGRAIWRQAHYFVLARVDLEAGVVGES